MNAADLTTQTHTLIRAQTKFEKLLAEGRLTLDGLRLDLARPDLRPAVMCDDIDGLDIRGLRAEGNAEAKSLIRLCDVRDAFITSSGPIGKAGPFIRVEGGSPQDVEISGNNLRNCTRGIEFASA